MTETPLALLSATELQQLYAADAVRPAEVLAANRLRIEELAELNAWLSVWPEEPARPLEEGPLAGVGVGVKDNFDTAGRVTTYASRVHREHLPHRDAAAVARLHRAGASILGKTHLHEFALGVTTESTHFGDCLNPHDHSRVAGGSSGGSAVAVATGMCCLGLGSDTSGSIRIPAAACGVVGLKPTFGRIGTTGCFPEAPSLDTVGALTRTVADAALMLDVLSGHDTGDPGSLDLPPTDHHRRVRAQGAHLDGMRIGVEREFFFDRVDPLIDRTVTAAIERLGELGAEIVEVTIPGLAEGMWALEVIDVVETTFGHRTLYADHRQDYEDDVRQLIERGDLPTGVDLLRARAVQSELRRVWAQIFDSSAGGVDVLAAPVLPIVTPHRGRRTVRLEGRECDRDAELMRLVGPANLAGLPAISVPCGTVSPDRSPLPVGLQLIGPHLGELDVLLAAAALEAAG